VIQSILFFVLGFLCAGFLALMIAPAIWRRAVNLTRKRVESSIPLTLSEIQAEKDALRAEFAMSTRRLEKKLKSTSEASARHAADLGRSREEAKQLLAERDDSLRHAATLQQRIAAREEELEKTGTELARVEERLAAARQQIDEQADELDRVNAMYDDASFASSSRQIELVARESEVDKLSADLSALRKQRKEIEAKARETATENRQLRAEAESSRKKIADLERKMARMMTAMTDSEEKLERRDKELERLRQQSREAPKNGRASVGDAAPSTPDIQRLESRLDALTKENRKLRETGGEGDEVLRQQLRELAAEVVVMAARLEKPDSHITRIVEAAPQPRPGSAATVSLAERIRDLQKRA
jgi:chromosome segregation ATPase